MAERPQIASSPSSPPWMDLPLHLTELILQRLPLSDHLRLAAVCSRWRSIIQRDQQQPPMLKLPWIISDDPEAYDLYSCFSPFEQKFSLFQFSMGPNRSILDAAHGWLLVFDDCMLSSLMLSPPRIEQGLYLMNPVSGSVIELPLLILSGEVSSGFVSSSPANADCTVIVLAGRYVFLWRIGDSAWTQLPCELESSIDDGILCGSVFYCRCDDWRFFSIDLAQDVPSLRLLDMDQSEVRPSESTTELLVQSNGEILLAQPIAEYDDEEEEEEICNVVGFKVFRADLIRKLWVRMKTLGDRVLFVSPIRSFSLLASEAGVEKGCVYFAPYLFEYHGASIHPWKWKGFDLRSGRMIDGPLLPSIETGFDVSQLRHGVQWFVPSLDVLHPDAAIAGGKMCRLLAR